MRGGRRFEAGAEEAGVLQGLPFAFRAVAPRWTNVFLGNAAWHYQSETLPRAAGLLARPVRALSRGTPAARREVAAEQPQLAHAELHLALPERLLATLRREGAL